MVIGANIITGAYATPSGDPHPNLLPQGEGSDIVEQALFGNGEPSLPLR